MQNLNSIANTLQIEFANAILNALQNNNSINVLLTTNIRVKTASAFKHLTITKISTVNATLNASSVYLQQVQASAARIATNADNADSVVNFEVQASKYEHLDGAYCIAMLNNALYLYTTINSGSSQYYIDNKEATKEEVMQCLTPSARQAMQSPTVYNQTNKVEHTVNVKTYKFSSIQSLTLLTSTQNTVITNDSFVLA
jgi:hypothetical protein